MASYKEKFYRKYVSTHNQGLYGTTGLAEIRAAFPAWRKQYGRFLPFHKEARIADLGCGDGGFVAWLRDAGYKNAEGVDVSEEQVAAGRAMGIDALSQADLREFLRDRAGSFDVLFLRDVLGHFPKEEVLEVLEAVHGALKDGGTLVVKTPNAESPFSGRLRYGDFTHDTSFTGQSLRQLLLVFGFKDVRVFSMRPAVHGLISGIRFLLWLPIELGIRIVRLVEAGSHLGWFTQNVMAAGRKRE